MSVKEKFFSGSQKLSGINLSDLEFGGTNYLGSGAFGDVYYVRDKTGKEAKDYAVKVLRRDFASKIRDDVSRFLQRKGLVTNPKGFLKNIDATFGAEVNALEQLKGQGIGPELVYANYTKFYYIVERMDRTLLDMIEDDSLSRSQILKLLALSDRYIESDFFHDDLHVNNVMWSDALADFRMIDWGISLFVSPEEQSKLEDRKINKLFEQDLMYIIMVYTKYKIQEGDEVEKEQWGVVQTKISDYIKRKFPGKVDDYDVFSPDYKYKTAVKNGLRMLNKIKNPVRLEPHGAVSFMDKVKREWDSFRGKKGGKTKCKRRPRKRHGKGKTRKI
jgi:serine/threonine protein kinase